MTDHTPGPLHIEDDWHAVSANGIHVAACGGHTALTKEQRIANAERIVRIWNCHDDLLEALKLYAKLESALHAGCTLEDEDWAECYQAGQAAIAKAS